MSIEPEALAAIVGVASYGAVPVARAETMIRIVKAQSLRATTDSPESLWLRHVLDVSAADIDPAALRLLEEVELYGVGLPLINAAPSRDRERRQIIVFDGLLYLVRYFAELISVLSCLQAVRPDARFHRVGSDEAEALAFSTAGFSILSDFVLGGRPPAAVGDMLGPRMLNDIQHGCRKAAVFIILHELGHHVLGHLTADGARAEHAHFSLIAPEVLGKHQEEELAADAFALQSLAPGRAGEYADGLMFLLGGFAFQEAFSGHLSTSHPLAVNRLNALAKAMDLPPPFEEIVRSWIEDRATNWRNFASQREAEGVDFGRRVHRTMPVEQAYQEIALIKERVAAETGWFDRDP